jgi:hypothetical protein
MRLVFVHGIAQEGKSEGLLEKEWLSALNIGLTSAGLSAVRSAVVPFYGDKLADYLTPARLAHPLALDPDEFTRSYDPSNDDYEAFAVQFGAEMVSKYPTVAARGGLASILAEIDDEDLLHRGIQNLAPVISLARRLDRDFPSVSTHFIKQFLQSVFCYLTNKNALREINELVRDKLFFTPEPTVLVGHSLGSVVAYQVLHAYRPKFVERFITIGSPLAISAIKQRLAPPPSRPPSISEWINGFDRNDIVALNQLDQYNFPIDLGVSQIEIANDTENHHGISGYLKNEQLAKLIVSVSQQ